MSTYKDIQHILIAIHIYAFEKNTHSHAQGIASKFTANHILNICYHKLPTHIWNIYHTTFIVSLTFIYIHVGKLIMSCIHLHSKGNSMPSYIHLGSGLNIHLGRYSFTLCKEFHAICSYIYTPLKGVFHATYICTHTFIPLKSISQAT